MKLKGEICVCKLGNFCSPSSNIYLVKYLSVKVKGRFQENRVCVGEEHICALTLITVPSVNQFGSPLAH